MRYVGFGPGPGRSIDSKVINYILISQSTLGTKPLSSQDIAANMHIKELTY